MLIWGDWLKPEHDSYIEDDSLRDKIEPVLFQLIANSTQAGSPVRQHLVDLGYSGLANAFIALEQTSPPLIGDEHKQQQGAGHPLIGNVCEILASEYFAAFLKLHITLRRLFWNPNAFQSMKGDDLIAFDCDPNNACPSQLYQGEVKWNENSMMEALTNADADCRKNHALPVPLSMNMHINVLETAGKSIAADNLRALRQLLRKRDDGISRVGCAFGFTSDEKGKSSNVLSKWSKDTNVLNGTLKLIPVVLTKGFREWAMSIYLQVISDGKYDAK